MNTRIAPREGGSDVPSDLMSGRVNPDRGFSVRPGGPRIRYGKSHRSFSVLESRG